MSMLHNNFASLKSLSEKWHKIHFNSTAATLPPHFLHDKLPVVTTTTQIETTATTTLLEVATTTSLVIPPPPKRANATFVFLCRNSDLAGVVSSIRQTEDRFNRHHQYPWVLLNEEPFTDEFKESVISATRVLHIRSNRHLRRVQVLTDAPVHFGLIPQEHWYQPDWIDEDRARAGRSRMMAKGIIYAGKQKLYTPSYFRSLC